MDWGIFWTAIGSAVGTIGLLASLILYLHSSLKEDIKGIKENLRDIKLDTKTIDQRLSRLEGAFEERGRWEARKTGTEK